MTAAEMEVEMCSVQPATAPVSELPQKFRKIFNLLTNWIRKCELDKIRELDPINELTIPKALTNQPDC